MFLVRLILVLVSSGLASDPEAGWRAELERRRPFGEQDTRFAKAAQVLGGLLVDRGKDAEARSLLEPALPVLEKALGGDHLDVAAGRYQLGNAYIGLGLYQEAEKLYLASQASLRRAFGEHGLEVAPVLVSLGALYRSTGRCGDSQKVLSEAMKILASITDDDSPRKNRGRAQLALAYACLGQYGNAVPLLRRALAAFEKTPEEPDLRSILLHLGNLHFTFGQLEEAEVVWRRTLLLLNRFPEDHIGRASILCNLGKLMLLQRRNAEAEPFLLGALAIGERNFLLTADLAPILKWVGDLYVTRAQFGLAEGTYQRALDITQSSGRSAASAAVAILMSLGRLRVIQKRLDEAVALFQRALDLEESVLGPQHPYFGDHLVEYAALLRKNKRKQEAKEMEIRARQIGEANRGNLLAGTTVVARN